jgi:hypothetical protein
MRKTLPALVATLFVLALLPAAGSSSVGGTKVLKTRGYVNHLAADGNRVAVAVSGFTPHHCNLIDVWNPARNAVTRIKTGVGCPGSETPKDGITTVALAGTRVAWIEEGGGMSTELSLRSRSLSGKKTASIAFTAYPDEGSTPTNLFGYLTGHGSLIAYNAWVRCTAIPVGWEGGQSCSEPAPGDQSITNVSEQKLLKIVNGESVEIATAPDAQASGPTTMSLAVVSIDGGRIVTQQPDGAMTLYSAAGDVVKQIAVPAGTFSGTALQSSKLVTLRDGNLELYNTSTGALTSTTPVAAGSVLRDLYKGLAVYVKGRKIHVLRLSDGKDVAYSPPGNGAVDAQIESTGLFYSYNYKRARDHGRIVFVRYAGVLQKLG